MKRFLVNLSDQELERLEKLLRKKTYNSRSDAFRQAIGLLFEAEKSPELKKIVEKAKISSTGFRPTENQIKEKIIGHLRRHPVSTINKISSDTGLHRHTARKYIAALVNAGVVRQKKSGVSVLSFLTKRRSKND